MFADDFKYAADKRGKLAFSTLALPFAPILVATETRLLESRK